MPRPLLAVDTPSLLYRAFHALPGRIRGADGRPVAALLGTANSILRVVAERRPRAVVCCFGQESATYRTDLYPAYHADRPPMPDDLRAQWEVAPGFLEAFGWYVAEHGELEADDLLAGHAAAEEAAGRGTLVLTGDRDMYQLASERTLVLYVRTGADGPEEVGPDEVRRRYGVDPEQVPDFIALRGDPSDGLPGARGIGEKTARDLLREHRTLEAVIEHARRQTPRRAAALRPDPQGTRDPSRNPLLVFRDIATVRRIAVDRPADRPTDVEGGARAARGLGMQRLAARLEQDGGPEVAGA
jgi:5'-3' exonuclease